MPFIPVPNGVQCEVRGSYLGERVENVFWFFVDGEESPTVATLGAIAADVFSWWDDHIKPIISANYTLREIYCTDQSSQFGGAYTYTTGLPADGANVQEPLPGNVALCVSLRTFLRGRSNRGRSYIVGLTENQVSGNQVTTASAAAWLAAYDVLVNTFNTPPYQLAVCSRFSGGLPRAQGVLTPIQDATLVDTFVDSQRRRLPGRGQ